MDCQMQHGTNPWTRAQIEALLQERQVEELRRRLCSRKGFGTAGLRAAMGAGFASLMTIIQSTQMTSTEPLGAVSPTMVHWTVIDPSSPHARGFSIF
ncbi:unnamed protein product [Coregonus sp. 'balchen']|nr:unnamed protein product [Coregonus sp. 'balchen']